jgi:hypothetical protein
MGPRPTSQGDREASACCSSLQLQPLRHVTAPAIGGKTLPDNVIAEIVERTDGEPLFIEELTKASWRAGCYARKEVTGCFLRRL